MLAFQQLYPTKWAQRALELIFLAANFCVFVFLDLVDFVLCFFYRFVDGFLEENPIPCYCQSGGEQGRTDGCSQVEEEEEEDMEEVSETLCERRNLFREMGSFRKRKDEGWWKRGQLRTPRWSDCSCETCMSWLGEGEDRLHLVVGEPSQDPVTSKEDCRRNSTQNVIFLHGFLSSSSLWAKSVVPNLSEAAKQKYRTFAMDLLGFGNSPKPMYCLYRLKDHLQMIEKSVIEGFQLDSYHLVAHSMGCIITLALAAKYPDHVKSITLIAPPCFPSIEEKASHTALKRLAERKIWPPQLLGSAVMSSYEHLGRTVCFLVCRNHRTWEAIIKQITGKRDLSFLITDFTKHTHHSAWHTMHNVICGGAKMVPKYLEVVKRRGIPVKIVHGNKDQLVPLECSLDLKLKVPLAELQVIDGVDHNTVITRRKKDLTRDLEQFWSLYDNYEKC